MKKKLSYSPYSRKLKKGDVFNFVDEHGLVLVDAPNGGKGDCIGRTLKAYMVYRDPRLVRAVAELWKFTGGMGDHPDTMKGIRHPDLHDLKKKMSRDHFVNTLCLFKEYFRDGYETEVVVEKFKGMSSMEIEHMDRITMGLKWWVKAINGSKLHEWLFYAWEILVAAAFYVPFGKLGNRIAGFGDEVDQGKWEMNRQFVQNQRKLNQWLNKAIFPAYARGYLLRQVYALDDNFPKMRKRLFKQHAKLVGSTNYLQKIQLGLDVPEEKVKWYQPMSGGRFTGWLNSRNDRGGLKMLKLKDNLNDPVPGYARYNLLDVDLLRYWWNKLKA